EHLDLSYNAQSFGEARIKYGRCSSFQSGTSAADHHGFAIADLKLTNGFDAGDMAHAAVVFNRKAHSSRTQMILSGPSHPDEDISHILDTRFVSGKTQLQEMIYKAETEVPGTSAGEPTSSKEENGTTGDGTSSTSSGAGGGAASSAGASLEKQNQYLDTYSPLSLFVEGLAENNTLLSLDLAHSGFDAKTA
ncbi:unnamed protein product, partial [Amoebophrya sp. A120]